MLHQAEAKILSVLSGRMSADEVARQALLPLDSVHSFAQSLKEKGYVSLFSDESRKASLLPDGMRCLSDGFPEQHVLLAAKSNLAVAALTPEEKSIGVNWATKNGWVRIEGGVLHAVADAPPSYPLQEALKKIESGGQVPFDELAVQVNLHSQKSQWAMDNG